MNKIHKTAIIEDGAELIGDDIEIGPYAVVSGNAKIYDRVKIMGHAMISGHTTLHEGVEVHPFAHIGGKTQDLKYDGGTTYVEVGANTVFREYVTINCGTSDGEVTKIGERCLIMAYCHVAHGCVFGNNIIVSNGTHFAGEVFVEDFATISGLNGFHQFCRIGRNCMVGAGCTITQDVAPFMITGGNPISTHGLNIVGLTRRGFSKESISALKEAYRVIFRSGKNVSEAIAEIEENSSLSEIAEVKHLVKFFKDSKRGVVR